MTVKDMSTGAVETGDPDWYTGDVGKSNWGERTQHDIHQLMNQEQRETLDSITEKVGLDPEELRSAAQQWGADGANASQVPEVYENGNYLHQQAAVSFGLVAEPNKSFEENNANFAKVINAANAAKNGTGTEQEVKDLMSEFGSPKAQDLTAKELTELYAFDPHENGAHMWGGAGSNPDSPAWQFMHAGAVNYREPEGEVASHGFSNDQHQGYQGKDGTSSTSSEAAAKEAFEVFDLSSLWS